MMLAVCNRAFIFRTLRMGGLILAHLQKSPLTCFSWDSGDRGQRVYYLFDSPFEAISLTQPWRQISSENRMTLKPYWGWTTLRADNTDTNNSMMHSSATLLLSLQKRWMITDKLLYQYVVKMGKISWWFFSNRWLQTSCIQNREATQPFTGQLLIKVLTVTEMINCGNGTRLFGQIHA